METTPDFLMDECLALCSMTDFVANATGHPSVCGVGAIMPRQPGERHVSVAICTRKPDHVFAGTRHSWEP